MKVVSVLQVAEDVLAPFGQHVVHHVIGDVHVRFCVLVISPVVQLEMVLETEIIKG